jgi:enoyl-CoA hydratase/carnithine racemase
MVPTSRHHSHAGVIVGRDERGVATITLNRPESRNALSHALVRELDRTLEDLRGQPDARVVVLAANGPVFSSGHDLRELVGRSDHDYREIFEDCTRMMQRLRALPQPVIARVQGPAVAAGCQLVAGCDLAVASESATFSTPGVKIGLFCTTPMVPLVRAIPAKPALEMLFTGRPIPARRAYELGLVNRVAPADQLDAALAELVDALLEASPLVLAQGKADFYRLLDCDESMAYDGATGAMCAGAEQADAREGIAAFLEKRAPLWPGRRPGVGPVP